MIIKLEILSLIWILLGVAFVGPAIYGVFFGLVSAGIDIFIGKFQWNQLWGVFGILVVPFVFEFMFFASFFMGVDGYRLTLLPTFLAAIIFWCLNWQSFKDSIVLSKFWVVLSRALAGSIVCLFSYLVFNPIFITLGLDALYFYKFIARPDPYAEWATNNDYGQLFHLTILALTGACLGAIHAAASLRFIKSNVR